MKSKTRLLLIEDDEGDQLILKELLNESKIKYDIITANNLTKALEIIESERFDIVLLDLGLPESQGPSTFDRFNQFIKDIPIILITGLDDEETGINLVKKGAQDYLIKGKFDSNHLERSIQYAIQRHLYEKKLHFLGEALKLMNTMLRHDFLNHLAVISMATEIMETKDEKMKEKIFRCIDSSKLLIDKIRDLERAVSFESELTEYEIKPLIEKIMEKYPEVKLELNGNCFVLADEAIYSLFENIINNSIFHGKTKIINITIRADEKMCVITIVDEGIGIPDEIKSHIFDEGFTFGAHKSTGLGLYIVKTIIDRYGGTIKVKDNEPNGVISTIHLKKSNR